MYRDKALKQKEIIFLHRNSHLCTFLNRELCITAVNYWFTVVLFLGS
jgi:hypothetical protein